ncbi:hypothetical protein [Arthrobacter sp. 2MCAF14]|uniref:hypothetical protein n=1 Tax=Arthrobacter sp. 2MCAF14 TaxID=3232982 RepID=UPI003F900348
MCDLKGEGDRCAKHSPEARAEDLASEKVQTIAGKLVAAGRAFIEEVRTAKSGEPTPALSRWGAMLQQLMITFAKARKDLAMKRVKAREVRQAHDLAFIERLRQEEQDRVARDEKRWGEEAIARADKAAVAAEEATLAVEAAEDELLDAEEELACALPGDLALSQYEGLQFQVGLAQADLDDAQDNYAKLLEKQKPADMIPGADGKPSRKRQALLKAEKDRDAALRRSRSARARLDSTLTHDQAEALRDAAAGRLEEAQEVLAAAKKERQQARCLVRDSSAVEMKGEVLAA